MSLPVSRHRARLVRLTPMLAALAACSGGGDGGTSPPDDPPTVASITIDPPSLTLIPEETAQLTATARSASGAALSGRTFSWSTSNLAVATVNNGLVTAITGGTATINVTSEGKFATAAVLVQPSVITMTILPTSLSLPVGQTGTLVATMLGAGGVPITGRAITWTTSNAAVATVAGGTVTAVAVGTARITASREGKSIGANVTVTPIPGAGQAVFASIYPALNYSCALDGDGKAYCWGDHTQGQLGIGALTGGGFFTPRLVSNTLTFTAISAGAYHACGVTSAGAAHCWGWNFRGEIGDGTTSTAMAPTPVSAGVFTKIAAGGQAGGGHTCALGATGAAFCWGWNVRGQLGDNSVIDRRAPTAVAGGLSFVAISAGSTHTCALTAGGKAYCWGDGAAIGDGTGVGKLVPTEVAGNLTFKSLTAGYGGACGITTGDVSYCWGNVGVPNANGLFQNLLSPTIVPGGLTFRTIAAGDQYGCGMVGAAAYCWGFNANAEVGTGDQVRAATPTLVTGGFALTTVVPGMDHTCGLTASGAAYCWGNNGSGELGDGTQFNRGIPVPVRSPQ